jgi:hypothetical protein
MGNNTVKMPDGAYIMHVGVQKNDKIVMWAEVDPSAEVTERKFRVYATGEPHTYDDADYVGTVQTGAGYVWHIYEVYPEE